MLARVLLRLHIMLLCVVMAVKSRRLLTVVMMGPTMHRPLANGRMRVWVIAFMHVRLLIFVGISRLKVRGRVAMIIMFTMMAALSRMIALTIFALRVAVVVSMMGGTSGLGPVQPFGFGIMMQSMGSIVPGLLVYVRSGISAARRRAIFGTAGAVMTRPIFRLGGLTGRIVTHVVWTVIVRSVRHVV